MEAKELRIGNIIKANGLYEGSIVFVNEIGQQGMLSEDKRVIMFEGLAIGEFIKYCEPIPLTEEWLLRFGFVVRDKTYSTNSGGELMRYAFFEEITDNRIINFVIYKSPRKGWTLDGIVSNKETHFFNYVHQLQNLFFALNGKELTLKNE